ncbi:MAG: fructose-bisphosphatase class II, partial [Senegalia sp. (in: firmicutes)]
MGIGGAPEGVITAAAIKAMGGDMVARLNVRSDEELQRCRDLNLTDEDIDRSLSLEDLVKGDEAFFSATGISDGDLLKGVVYKGNNVASTHSIVMRSKTGTIRFVEAIHKLDKNDILINLMKKHGKA